MNIAVCEAVRNTRDRTRTSTSGVVRLRWKEAPGDATFPRGLLKESLEMTTDDSGDQPATAVDAGPFVEDRRDHRRVEFDADVTVQSPGNDAVWSGDFDTKGGGLSQSGLAEDAEFMVDGEGEDISVGGMFVLLEDRLPAGVRVEVEFEISELSEAFDFIAEVRWTRRISTGTDSFVWGAGLEFQEIDSDQETMLEDYVLEKLSG